MYMLEGASRWNINRGRQAVDMGGTSLTKIYDVRLMSHMNDLSNRVLGCLLLPEFTPPGKPTGKIKHGIFYYDTKALLACLLNSQTIIFMTEHFC